MEQHAPVKSPPIMYVYAAFLVVCGFTAFALSGFTAMTAAIIPTGLAVLMVIFGVMASKVWQNRTLGMIGIHAGLVVPLLLAALFGFMSYGRFTREEPVVYLGVIFTIMAIGSLITFVLILLTRPKPEARV